jgi:hypothetical protein
MEWVVRLVPALLAIIMTYGIVRDQRQGVATASRGLFRFERTTNPFSYHLLTALNVFGATFLWLLAAVMIDFDLWRLISN